MSQHGSSPRHDAMGNGHELPMTPGHASATASINGSPAPATPALRQHVRSSLAHSPDANSIASQSPRFAHTPRTGSIRGSPLASPPAAASSVRQTPVRSPVPHTPAQSSPMRFGPQVAHRGWLASSPSPSATRSGGDEEMEGAVDDGNFLYGTDINESQIKNEFRRFIRKFRSSEMDSTQEQPSYLQELARLWERAEKSGLKEKGIKFPISGKHLHEFSPKLYGHLINFPTEVIPLCDYELWQISEQYLDIEPEDLGPCQVKIYDLLDRDARVMRNMNPSDIEKLISIKGIVIRCSDLSPDMNAGLFRCTTEGCKNEVKVKLSHWTIEEPTRCEGCGKSHSFQIIHNDCKFSDRQVLKLQETPELVPEGETPYSVAICCFDDLVDYVRPGDRVEIAGIYKAAEVRPIRGWKTVSSVYRTYLDAIAITAEKKTRIDFDNDEDVCCGEIPTLKDEKDLDPELVGDENVKWNKRIRNLAQEVDERTGRKTIVDKLVQSFAPSIYEEDKVKRGLLCQLFGGTPKAASELSKARTRPEINTLLCGDPSTAKSQLLQYAYKLAPRGMYTSGKGSSAVGLTASINKDPTTGEIVLESGALVLADHGICCIDEFDKMDENARSILHQAMEQQTVSVAKAGIVCTLNARTAILATANPRDSSYDPKKSVVDNINMPKNLMSRFDFIWLMLDKRDREMDRRLAEHLLSMYSVNSERKTIEAVIDPDLFRRYVAFAKRWVHPIISEEASKSLIANYTSLRNMGGSREILTATPRQLESLIRISESIAKMELREVVTAIDVDEAVQLLKDATYASAIDPETGLIDMEQLIAGVGAGKRKRAKYVDALLVEVLEEKKQGDAVLTIDSVRSCMNEKLGAKNEHLLSELEFSTALRNAEQDRLIVRRGRQIEVH